MSRQSKTARLKAIAKRFSEVRQGGGRSKNPGPQHGKDWTKRLTNRTTKEFAERVAKFFGTGGSGPNKKTSARGTNAANKILENAGRAAS